MNGNAMTAARAAVAKARKHAGAASMVAALVPLGVLAGTSAARAILAPPPLSVTLTSITAAGGGVFDWGYTFNLAAFAPSVTAIEIPDIGGTAFAVGSGGAVQGTLPTGWSGAVVTTATLHGPTLHGPTLKDGTVPAAWLDLTTTGSGIAANSGQTFTLESPYSISSNAFINYAGPNSFAGTIDPLVPGTVPEPASLAVLGVGLLGLFTAWRRKPA